MDGLRAIARTLWIGGMWVVGIIVAPILFSALDNVTAGMVAGRLFAAIAWVGLVCGIGGVVAGGYFGDFLTRRGGRGGHARAIGLSLIAAVPFGVASLLITHQATFMVLTAITVFLLSVYNGPAAAVIDELGPPHYAATLQSFAMFWVHVLGNAPAGSVVGWIADRSTVALGLQTTVAAMGVAGVLFMIVARRQKVETVS